MLPVVLFGLLPMVAGQNPICPMCSLGYPEPNLGTPTNSGPSPTFQSYRDQPQSPSARYQQNSPDGESPLSMYSGDAELFGAELGRAIALRIQQVYSSRSPSSPSSNGESSSYNSYPRPFDTRTQQPSPNYRNPGVIQSNPTPSYNGPSMNNYPGMIPPAQTQYSDLGSGSGYGNSAGGSTGGCPYCFGNRNQGYGAYRSRRARKNQETPAT